MHLTRLINTLSGSAHSHSFQTSCHAWLNCFMQLSRNFKKLYIGLYFGFCINIFLVDSFWKHQFSSVQSSLWSNSHICTWLHSLAIWAFVGKVMSLLFNKLSRFVIAFLLSTKHLFIDAFKLWCCRRLLRVPWTTQIKPVNPKGNQPWIFTRRTDAEAEAPILWPPDAKNQLTGKDPDAGKDWRQEEKGVTEDEMVGWHHWLNGHGFEQTLGDTEGQGKDWRAAVHEVERSQTGLSDWTELN